MLVGSEERREEGGGVNLSRTKSGSTGELGDNGWPESDEKNKCGDSAVTVTEPDCTPSML